MYKGSERLSSKANKQMASKHMKRCSTALVTKEMLIKTKMRYYFIPICIAIIKKTVTIVGKDINKVEISYIIGGNINWCNHFRKYSGISSKNKT